MRRNFKRLASDVLATMLLIIFDVCWAKERWYVGNFK
jgi:hypothetical protein